MRVRFLADHDEETRRTTGLVAATPTGVYRWIPNFGAWIRDAGAARRLYSHEIDREFQEIATKAAGALVETLPPYDAHQFAWILSVFEKEMDRLSSADLGLDPHTGHVADWPSRPVMTEPAALVAMG